MKFIIKSITVGELVLLSGPGGLLLVDGVDEVLVDSRSVILKNRTGDVTKETTNLFDGHRRRANAGNCENRKNEKLHLFAFLTFLQKKKKKSQQNEGLCLEGR